MRVWNKRNENPPKGAVYVGRPTKWGNPFPLGQHLNRAEVIEKYEQWLCEEGPIADIAELRGKDLVCWCAPLACHADILLKRANA